MTRAKRRCSALLMSLGFAMAMLPLTAPLAAPPPTQGVHIKPIGRPTWKPVDFHLFSAPIGTADSGYAEFLETQQAILPPPNHVLNPSLGIGPGAPHSPPYDKELARGVDHQGFHEKVRFHTSEFSRGQGVFLVWMNVPAPGKNGSSPDFAHGPIIPNNLFPIHVVGITHEHNKVFNPFLADVLVPPLDASLTPPFHVDGHSHFPFFIAENADFGPANAKLRGNFDFQIMMIDQSGNGWSIEAHFVIAP